MPSTRGSCWSIMLGMCAWSNTFAATIPSASCSAADVQAAIDAASDGDTVLVPACANGVWSSEVVIPNTKGITLMGMGTGITVISSNSALRVNTLPSNAPVRVTGFTFVRTGLAMRVYMLGLAQDWRIDHNVFDDAGLIGAYTIEVGVKGNENLDSYNFGVIDHNQFIGRNYGTSVHVSWVRWGALQLDAVASGDWVWSQPAQRGTRNMVYIEDNVFSSSPGGQASQVLDTQYGGQAVVRYNTIHNPWISTHSGCTNNGRNTPWTEIYRNTFTEDGDRYTGNMTEIRSASGVVWGNGSASTIVNFNIGVDHERSWRSDCSGPYGGQADGTRPFDENQGPHGYRAFGQPGWGPPQLNDMSAATFSGVFAWENLNNGIPEDLFIANTNGYTTDHLQFGRELFNMVDVTMGPIADRPLSCSVGPPRSVYISTDENPQGPVIHVAFATNQWAKHWEPFCYPHPLVSGLPCDLSTAVAGSSAAGSAPKFLAYPDPTAGDLHLSSPDMQAGFRIDVYDQAGVKVLGATSMGTSMTLDLSALASGIYTLHLSDPIGTGTASIQRIVKITTGELR